MRVKVVRSTSDAKKSTASTLPLFKSPLRLEKQLNSAPIAAWKALKMDDDSVNSFSEPFQDQEAKSADSLTENLMTPNSDAMKSIIENTRQFLKVGETLLPTFFVGNGQNVSVLGVQWATEQDKDIAAAGVKRLAKEMSAIFVLFVAETWMLSEDAANDFMKNPKKYKSVAEHPGAEEVVYFTLETKTKTWFASAPILKDRELGEVTWRLQDQGAAKGRFTDFLVDKPVMH
jgi:hypothetical protein